MISYNRLLNKLQENVSFPLRRQIPTTVLLSCLSSLISSFDICKMDASLHPKILQRGEELGIVLDDVCGYFDDYK